jgi:putative hydrolase of the HAD superfamily
MTMKPVWVFDLDNTLHNASAYVFPHISRGMTAYLQQHLDLDEAAASELRVQYWERYGATLTGMMKHHGTNPQHFLWHTHQFPELHKQVLREPRLRHVLRNLPGRKLLYSNSPQHYARAVLQLLRIDDLFDDVFAIEHARFRPKPEIAGFMRLLKKYRLRPAQCIMVEDSVENLLTAKRLGMRTVLVGGAGRRPACVDVRIGSVMDLPRTLARLI